MRRTAPGQPAPRAGRPLAESSRVEAFSDGVLAIAITLLVLDLHTEFEPGGASHAILDQWPTYLAYVASFMYIGVVWVNHHSLFTRIDRVDTGLLWCNLGLLLTASVLPFPTAELATAMSGDHTHGDQVSALLLYAVISSAMAASWLVTFIYLHTHQQLLSSAPAGFYRAEQLRAIPGIIVPFAPALVGLWQPRAALALLVVMPVFYAVTANGMRQSLSPPAFTGTADYTSDGDYTSDFTADGNS